MPRAVTNSYRFKHLFHTTEDPTKPYQQMTFNDQLIESSATPKQRTMPNDNCLNRN